MTAGTNIINNREEAYNKGRSLRCVTFLVSFHISKKNIINRDLTTVGYSSNHRSRINQRSVHIIIVKIGRFIWVFYKFQFVSAVAV